MVVPAEARTKAYFAVQRQWIAHWPFDKGVYLPHLLMPSALPMTPIWLQVDPHTRMWLDPDDYVSRRILETGRWEEDSIRIVRERLSPGATFIDVGADIGYYSLKAAPVVGVSGHVIAVEPNPEALERLRRNIAANRADVIAVAPVACSNAESTLELYAADKANMGESSLSKANALQAGEAPRAYIVRARPLDSIVQESGVTRVDAIKIDVEGAEYLVLTGAQQTLDRFRPMVLVEIVEHQLRAMGTSSAEVKAMLHAHGHREGRTAGTNVEFVPATATASSR
jgi:FkbM family methyltransferase